MTTSSVAAQRRGEVAESRPYKLWAAGGTVRDQLRLAKETTLKMVSHGVSGASVAVVLVLVATVAGEPEPGLFQKGRVRCQTHYKHVPHYETVIKKFPVYQTLYNEQYVPAPVYHTEYITKYQPQYETEYVPEVVYTTLYTKKYAYVTKNDVKYETQYKTEYVPQYVTVTKTQESYKTVCPKSPYTPY